jgi:hypothetical protein
MKLIEAQKKLEELKRVKISFSVIGKALGFSKQRAFQLQENILKPEQIEKLEKFFDVNLKQTELDISSIENKKSDKKLDTTDIDLEQVMNLYIKFRAGDIQAGDLLDEKIRLMKKILVTHNI